MLIPYAKTSGSLKYLCGWHSYSCILLSCVLNGCQIFKKSKLAVANNKSQSSTTMNSLWQCSHVVWKLAASSLLVIQKPATSENRTNTLKSLVLLKPQTGQEFQFQLCPSNIIGLRARSGLSNSQIRFVASLPQLLGTDSILLTLRSF